MIRSFSEEDLDEIIELEVLTQFLPWTKAIFEQCFKAGCQGWVLEQTGKVIGFVIVNLQGDEGHILDICIHPNYQAQGLGHQLLSYVLKIMKEKGTLFAYLEVRCTNHPAIALYQKLEFVEMATRKDYYLTEKGREDAIVFAKELGVDDTL